MSKLYCVYIVNLYNKHKTYYNNPTNNEIEYIHKHIKYQDLDVIYLYKFSNGNKFYVVNSTEEEPLIIPIKDDLGQKFRIFLGCYGPKKSMDETINSIINKLKIIGKKFPHINKTFDDDKMKQFLYKLSNDKDAEEKFIQGRDTYIKNTMLKDLKKYDKDIEQKIRINTTIVRNIQDGGGIIGTIFHWIGNTLSPDIDNIANIHWLKKIFGKYDKIVLWALMSYLFPIFAIQQAFNKYLPWWLKWIGWIFAGLIEYIDFTLGILAMIPLEAVFGIGWIIDALTISFSFMRFDLIGVVSGLISIIPIAGDIGGGILKGSGKIAKLVKYIFKPVRVALGWGDELIDVMKFGGKFGKSATKIIEFFLKHGEDGVEIIKIFIKSEGNVAKMGKFAVKFGEKDFTKIVEFLAEHEKIILEFGETIVSIGETIVKYGEKYGDKLLHLVKFGKSYPGKVAAIVGESTVKLSKKGVKIAEKETIKFAEEKGKKYAQRVQEELQEQISKSLGTRDDDKVPEKIYIKDQGMSAFSKMRPSASGGGLPKLPLSNNIKKYQYEKLPKLPLSNNIKKYQYQKLPKLPLSINI